MYQHRDKRGGVVLTADEAEVTDLFLRFVTEGESIKDAAQYALSAVVNPDPKFTAWLSQGMLGHENQS